MEKRFIVFETLSEPIDPNMEQLAVRPLFARIVESLKKNGADIVEGPTEWDSYGWYADFRVGALSLTCMMQRSDAWLLLINCNRSFMDRIKGRQFDTELSEFADHVVDAVREATGVSSTLYHSEEEFRASYR